MSVQPHCPTNARVAVLTALLSLTAAAQALAPAGASAVAPNPTAGGCQSVPFVGAVWNGSEFCPFKEGGGEVITVESRFNPCTTNPSLCMAYQPNRGSGPLRVGDDSGGPGPGQSSGAGKRAEVPKKLKLLTKDECLKILADASQGKLASKSSKNKLKWDELRAEIKNVEYLALKSVDRFEGHYAEAYDAYWKWLEMRKLGGQSSTGVVMDLEARLFRILKTAKAEAAVKLGYGKRLAALEEKAERLLRLLMEQTHLVLDECGFLYERVL